MKQIFDWLREQMHKTANINNSCPSEMCWTRTSKNCDKCDLQSLKVREIFEVINEAEAKWEAEHKSYDVEKVVEQIHEYFNGKIDACEEDIVPHEILEYNKAVCEIVRKGGVE